MVKFVKEEERGRVLLNSLLEQLGFTNIEETDIFDRVDCYAQKGNARVCFEVKVRNLIDRKTGKLYDESMLEVSKIAAIMERVKEKHLNGGFYACFFQNKAFIYNLQGIKYRRAQIMCPYRTAGDNHLVMKDIVYFKTLDAKIFEQIDGKWYACNQQTKEEETEGRS